MWGISQGSLQAQARSRVDVHSAAERVYEQLMLLEALSLASHQQHQQQQQQNGGSSHQDGGDGAAARDALSSSSSRRSGSIKDKAGSTSSKERERDGKGSGSKKRTGSGKGSASGKGAGQDGAGAQLPALLPAPPTGALRALHPAYFAEPLAALPGGGGALGVLGGEEAQKQQLGTFLQVRAPAPFVPPSPRTLCPSFVWLSALRKARGGTLRDAAPLVGPPRPSAQVFAWLLRVAGWEDLSRTVEGHVETRTPPPRAAGRAGSNARGTALQPRSSSSSSSTAAPSSPRAPAPPPAKRQGMAVCPNVLQVRARRHHLRQT